MPAAPQTLAIQDFTYELPPGRIANEPMPDRAASRLLLSRGGTIEDKAFADLPTLLPPGALLVFNDTKVVRARLLARKPTGAVVELFCLEPVAPHTALEPAMQQTGSCVWRCLVGNGKRWKDGPVTLGFEAHGQPATLVAHRHRPGADVGQSPGNQTENPADNGTALVQFAWQPATLRFADVLAAAGGLPLPPYLNRAATPADAVRYQTVYAAHEGAVAAPTAGLHFTPELLAQLAAQGFGTARLTLHVGAGTFQPVKAAQMADHAMHTEALVVEASVLRQLLAQRPRPVIAVGTTSMRTLESLYWLGAGLLLNPETAAAPLAATQWQPYATPETELPTPEAALHALLHHLETTGTERLEARTGLLIAPGYRFRLTDGLITNFHQPESTLLLLVAALVGPHWRTVYAHALAQGYRFLSYGDSSLLLP